MGSDGDTPTEPLVTMSIQSAPARYVRTYCCKKRKLNYALLLLRQISLHSFEIADGSNRCLVFWLGGTGIVSCLLTQGKYST